MNQKHRIRDLDSVLSEQQTLWLVVMSCSEIGDSRVTLDLHYIKNSSLLFICTAPVDYSKK
jgi:hypothetical protein